MVYDSSIRSHQLGKDPNNTFVAKIVPAKHWKPQNDLLAITGLPAARVKIRIVGDDPPSQEELPDEDCRWAIVAQPPGIGGGSGGRGEHISYVGGETVIGYFLDSDDRQQPVITGSLPAFQKTSVNIASANAYDIAYLIPGENEVASYPANAHDDSKNRVETNGIVALGGGPNKAEENLEEVTTNDISSYSKCGDDTISKTKNAVYDFMMKTQKYEEFGGKIIDPLTNEIINMPVSYTHLRAHET